MTLIVNLFGGPGIGKSTIAAELFSQIKKNNKETCELVTEAAKDAVWENRFEALKCQPYIFGKQLFRIEKLIDKVDVIISDSPLLLSCIYNDKYKVSFNKSVIDIFNSFENLNFVIDREPSRFQIEGRYHTETESVDKDNEIILLLNEFSIDYKHIIRNTSVDTIYKIIQKLYQKK